MGTRLKGHQAARRGEIEKSTIAEHAWSNHHQPLWEETRVLDQADINTILLINEDMHTSLQNVGELMNRGQDLSIDCCWKHLSEQAQDRQQGSSRTGAKIKGHYDVISSL